MKVLVACEYSGRVRDAFIRRGHTALSCDLRETEVPGPHYRGDVRDVLTAEWDLLIAHPPCTFNTLAGIRWMYHPDDTALPAPLRRRHPRYPFRMVDFERGIAFFKLLAGAPIARKCLENSRPHGLALAQIGAYTQAVQPWHFGHGVTKAARLWLDNLPPLQHTHSRTDYAEIVAECHTASPGPERERERSRTSWAIAEAMATQWGNLLP